MATHKVELVMPNIEIENADCIVKVMIDNKLRGMLRISKGTVDWTKAYAKKTHHVLDWEDFAELMEREGTPTKK